jgi:signal transduction histidine kinase
MTRPNRSRTTFVAVLLVATLALTGALAYEAVHAARSHRAAAENVLRDYSSFATWELTRLARQQLLEAMNHGLSTVRIAHRQGDLRKAVGESPGCPSGCGGHERIVSAFHTPLPEVRFTFAGASVDDAVKMALLEAIERGRRTPDDFTCPTLQLISVNGTEAAVVWAPSFERSSRPTALTGFVTDASFAKTVFEKLVQHNPLLPPSLVPAGSNPNSALVVRVTSPGGRQLFASPGESSSYETTATLPPAFGQLQLAIALRPSAAGELVIGGLPRERLPLVIGLLALTVGFIVVAVVQLRREAEISRIRADFVSGVSHELRTPLAQIRMFTETLLLGRIRNEGEARRSLEIIAREAQRLAQLVENVLLFSRSERRRPEIVRENVRLAPLLRDIVEGFTPLAAGRQTTVVTDLDEGLSARVDSGAVRQVMLNLLDNAVKYGPTGQTVLVSLRFERGEARLWVDDEGPGVSATDGERIWQPFKRLAVAGTASGGAGIGLAIVKQLIELHGGHASVERAPSGGARFVVTFPGAWQDPGVAAVA